MTSLFSRRRFLAAVATLPVVGQLFGKAEELGLPVIGQLVRKPDELAAMDVVVNLFCPVPCSTQSAIGSVLSLTKTGTSGDWEWMTILFTVPVSMPPDGVSGICVYVNQVPMWYCGVPGCFTLCAGEVASVSFIVNSQRLALALKGLDSQVA